MRFLIEAEEEKITRDLINRWSKAGFGNKGRKFDAEALEAVVNPEWLLQEKELEEAVYKALSEFGIDPNMNPFIGLFRRYDGNPDFTDLKQLAKKIRVLIDMHNKGDVFPTKSVSSMTEEDFEHLLHPEIYSRSEDDFYYVVKLFRTLNDPQRAKKFFADTDVINREELFDKNGEIKPVGQEAAAPGNKTLAAVVNKWSVDNEVATPTGKYSLRDVMEDRGMINGKKLQDNIVDIYKEFLHTLTREDSRTAFMILSDLVRNSTKLSQPNDRSVQKILTRSKLSSMSPIGTVAYIIDTGELVYRAPDKKWYIVDTNSVRSLVNGANALLNKVLSFKQFEDLDPEDADVLNSFSKLWDQLNITKEAQRYIKKFLEQPVPSKTKAIPVKVDKKDKETEKEPALAG